MVTAREFSTPIVLTEALGLTVSVFTPPARLMSAGCLRRHGLHLDRPHAFGSGVRVAGWHGGRVVFGAGALTALVRTLLARSALGSG